MLEICDRVTSDEQAYERRSRLLAPNPELRARDALKVQQIGETLIGALTSDGTDERIAALAVHLALACYQAGRHHAATPAP